jgi:hypothetical protein
MGRLNKICFTYRRPHVQLDYRSQNTHPAPLKANTFETYRSQAVASEKCREICAGMGLQQRRKRFKPCTAIDLPYYGYWPQAAVCIQDPTERKRCNCRLPDASMKEAATAVHRRVGYACASEVQRTPLELVPLSTMWGLCVREQIPPRPWHKRARRGRAPQPQVARRVRFLHRLPN